MAKGGGRLLAMLRRSYATLLFGLTLLASAQESEAACYRLLKPNGWQYETVCNNSGGGGRGYSGGGGGGYNYGAAIGAAGAAIGILQGLMEQSQPGPSSGGGAAPPVRSCQAGYRLLRGGGCGPVSAVDCGNRTYCPAGHVCQPGGKCATPGMIESLREFQREQADAERQRQDVAAQELNEIRQRIARQQSEPSSAVAGLPPRQANPFATSRSGASGKPEATPSTVRERWSGSGDKADCERAGRLERNTAAWDAMCGPKAGKKAPEPYRSNVDAQNITIKAKAQCGTASAANMSTCVMNAKARILLADDPFVRAKCLSETGLDQMKCIELAYLFGPAGPSVQYLNRYLRADIQERLDRVQSNNTNQPTEYQTAPVSALPTGCEPGFGMKPTPDGFGAWSCQKLGVLFFAPDRQTLIQEDSPEGLEAIRGFEHGINEVAAIAAAAAVHEHGGALSEDERKTCSAAAFAAARSALKGDNVDVPEFCHAIVEAAQAALARYADADARVAALNPGVDALLAAYNEGVNQPPAVPPSELGGLEPDQEMRRDAACMRGEGSGCTDTGRAPISSPLATEACDNVVEVIEKAKAAEATFKSLLQNSRREGGCGNAFVCLMGVAGETGHF